MQVHLPPQRKGLRMILTFPDIIRNFVGCCGILDLCTLGNILRTPRYAEQPSVRPQQAAPDTRTTQMGRERSSDQVTSNKRPHAAAAQRHWDRATQPCLAFRNETADIAPVLP